MNKFFKVLYQSKKSKARVGEIITDHGIIKTPAFVAVGTKGTIKSIFPKLLSLIKTQAAFVNTYHLVTHPGAELIEKAGGIHQWTKLSIPLMSDSGGFQVFSLARKDRQKIDKKNEKLAVLKINEEGVKFRSPFDGSIIEFTPEKSIEYQVKIGADILMAFDECIYYPASFEYTKKATDRTHQWLLRCVKKFRSQQLKFKNKAIKQYLYGIIQGGMDENLRKKSARLVVSQAVDGVAIGGVSVGEPKKEMRKQVKWVADFLPNDRPVHLLGVGQIDDILDLVSFGVDTFDCVEPTRLARMGRLIKLKIKEKGGKIISESEEIDILKGRYRYDLETPDKSCRCYLCQNFTKSYLHHLFKNRELLAYTLATYHNLWVMEELFSWIRKKISEDKI